MTRSPSILAIRPSAIDDKETLIELWQRCGLPTREADWSIGFIANRDHAILLVGAVGEVIVASVMTGHDGHRGWLYFVAVEPGHQKNGYGAQMVVAAEAWLRARGVTQAMLMVRADNHAVVSFYEGMGWASVPNLVMQKRLID